MRRVPVLTAGLVCSVGVAILLGLPRPGFADAGLDHFTCYRSRTVKGAPDYTPRRATLVDRFGSRSMKVYAQEQLCVPADVNGLDPSAPSHPDQLMSYLTLAPIPHFAAVHGLQVTNQFGTSMLDARTPDHVLVPTALSVSAPPPPLDPVVDHYSCYRVKPAANTLPFAPVAGVTVEDRFGTMQVDLRKPRELCFSVNKNDEDPGAETHTPVLVCYPVKRSQGTPAFPTVSPLFVDNQFGPWTVDVRTPYQLCVPSSVAE